MKTKTLLTMIVRVILEPRTVESSGWVRFPSAADHGMGLIIVPGGHDRVATTGFSRMSDRQLGLWDIKNPKEPLGGFQILDSISGVCMPFWDDGTNMLYLAGKG